MPRTKSRLKTYQLHILLDDLSRLCMEYLRQESSTVETNTEIIGEALRRFCITHPSFDQIRFMRFCESFFGSLRESDPVSHKRIMNAVDTLLKSKENWRGDLARSSRGWNLPLFVQTSDDFDFDSTTKLLPKTLMATPSTVHQLPAFDAAEDF